MIRNVARILIALLCSTVISSSKASSQTLASTSVTQIRARAIVDSFNKSKHVVKAKYGIRREKYRVVRGEAVVKSPADYSGTYEVRDLGFVLHLRVDSDGRVEGMGEEPMADNFAVRRRFTLRDAKIDGAVLTATKVYSGGVTEWFEGVFLNLTSHDSPTDPGVTAFGLGVIGKPIQVGGVDINRFFYELKR